MFIPRSSYLDSSYSPGAASQWYYGGTVVPNQSYALKRRLASLKNFQDPSAISSVASENFQRFLNYANDPSGAGLSNMKLPPQFLQFSNLANAFASNDSNQ